MITLFNLKLNLYQI